MGRPLELDELVERFTLLPDEVALLRNKPGRPGWGSRCCFGFHPVGKVPGRSWGVAG
jgi:hypothetical protein